MSIEAAYGLLAHALVFGALTALLPFGMFRARVALAATALSLMIGIAPLMLAFFGPPSTTLLCLAVLQLSGAPISPLSRWPAAAVPGTAVGLYLSAAGWLPGDMYALGYQPWPLLAALLAIGVALCWKNQTTWLLILAIALLAYAGGLFANLWQALLDPLLVLLALAVVLRQGAVRFIASRNR
ncbi:hypothetical protein LZ012_05300 [Dechloromonas sp. XY25]|uniref:Uncharacterized protein n=1 Tax=Dechloromonas hankyongensis TaxID=2908002 RepID=A0ABS9JZS9_9RHOO|nr:hypothetical protein [Dechloromonas hankyongensis]MCG2576407.1 hypothetical protein [Dechloromonas hankyongensis]